MTFRFWNDEKIYQPRIFGIEAPQIYDGHWLEVEK